MIDVLKATGVRSFGVGLLFGAATWAYRAVRLHQELSKYSKEDKNADKPTSVVGAARPGPALIRWWESD